MKDFNFLPEGYRDELRKRKSSVVLKKVIIPYSVVMALMVVVPVGINMKLKRDKRNIEREISNEEYYRQKSDQYKILQNIYLQREQQAKALESYGIDPSNVIDDLQRVMPDNMYIEYLNVNESEKGVFLIDMRCIAKTKEDAATFLEILRKNNKYYFASVSSIEENLEKGTIEFNFGCTYSENV